jgi:hypothetical protein
MLSVPFNPDERVPLIKPDTLEIVHVRRQHIIDCELTARGSTPADVFKDPSSTAEPSTATMDASRAPHSTDLSFSDTDDEGKSNAAPTEQADIDAVRLQNRLLRKRTRDDETPSPDLFLQDGDEIQAFEPRFDNHASSFRPSQVEQQVHSAIVHPNLQGKNAQAVLESAQQGPRTKFLASPPVLRAAYDMSFGIRGLSLMHFRRFYETFDSQTTTGLGNMTKFGRSNTLQPATPPASIAEILDAFDTLLHFAKGFYNTTAYNFFKAGARFMEKYAALTRPDLATCAMLVFWINSKFGKFRSEVVTSDLRTAALVGQAFVRNDDHLMELLQSQQDRRVAALLAPKPGRPASIHRPGPTREQRNSKSSAVPRELTALLPKQEGKTLCMRYLSKKGCSGPNPGQCFDPNRAHFKPLALPADAKSFIDKNFFGLAPGFNDLCCQASLPGVAPIDLEVEASAPPLPMVQPQCPWISAPRVHAPGGAPQDGHAFSKYKSAFGHQRLKHTQHSTVPRPT